MEELELDLSGKGFEEPGASEEEPIEDGNDQDADEAGS